MDKNIDLIKTEEKKKIYSDLFNIVFEQLKLKKISIKTSQTIAEFIINNMNFIDKKEDLMLFIENLSILWDFFGSYYLKYKKEELERQDRLKIEEISKRIFNFVK